VCRMRTALRYAFPLKGHATGTTQPYVFLLMDPQAERREGETPCSGRFAHHVEGEFRVSIQ
jgi:hypothetical protein